MMTNRGTIVGVFHSHSSAQDAVRQLRDAGFTDSQIGVIGRDGDRTTDAGEVDDNTYAGEGAAAGLAAGAGVGALWGLGIIAGALPAIGPAIAGGTLAAILSSAAAGAATAGIAGALIGMGMSKEEAEFYEGEVNSGRTVITVHAGDRDALAMSILRQNGAYDMHNQGTHRTVDVPVTRHDVTGSPSSTTGLSGHGSVGGTSGSFE